MAPWVRYSMAAYLGFLLAGSLAAPMPRDSHGSGPHDPLLGVWLGPVSEQVSPSREAGVLHWLARERSEPIEAPLLTAPQARDWPDE